jgi:hypothetical protein
MGAQQELAGCVISAVGSLSLAQLRLAGATQARAPTCTSPPLAAAAP